MMTKRRNFIKKSSLGLLAGLGTIGCATAKEKSSVLTTEHKPAGIPKDLTILFQGDSITDAGRDRGAYYANRGSGLGGGYVKDIAFNLLGDYPTHNLKIYNRGISGHKVPQLDARWDDDCINLKPDVMSLMIGVNDYWHKLNGRYDGSAQLYNTGLRSLLERTFKSLPNLKLIMFEPFAVAGGSAISDVWNREFTPYRDFARAIAKDFNATLIPSHTLFQEALEVAPASYWCPDGVHPSLAGGHLLAKEWLKVFTGLYA